jgi:hypothetical protein
MSIINSTTIKTLCLPGYGQATCRYLVVTNRGAECAKLSGLQPYIDAQCAAGTATAYGDNCPGIALSRPALPLLPEPA